jgi:ATP-dependent helicase HrpB
MVMLEPRRLAARAAARRMAALSGGAVGGFVGYRMRGDTRSGAATRIEVVTEGVLTRMLVSDPTLDGVCAVIFDEFHERSVIADTGLALTLRTAELLRPELRLLVMSATLDGERVAALLGGAPLVTAHGRAFPVETRWIPARPGARPLDAVPMAVQRALSETDGDVLVFLPGAGEIRRMADRIHALVGPGGPRVFALHGTMPAEEQDDAIAPSPPGRRKVVLATSIAETSLTIEGVRAVVDSGLARVPRFDPRSGMTHLETIRVTQDAAEQRRGRAGRVAPGVCYRLWAESEHGALLARRTPEILSADLAPLALDLAQAGADDPATLAWLDAPPAAALAQARTLLAELEALDPAGGPTSHGARMASLGLHPRLAHLVLRGHEAGRTRLACEIAALLGERDLFLRGDHDPDPDLALRIAVLRGDGGTGGEAVDRGRVMRVREEARRIAERVGGVRGDDAANDAGWCGELLALAYPDRVALARDGARGGFRMRNGRGARVADGSPLARERALAIAATDGVREDARAYLAAALDPARLETLFAGQIVATEAVALDDATGVMQMTTRRMLGELVLAEQTTRVRDPALVSAAIMGRVRRDGIASLPWNEDAKRTRERLAFLHRLDAAWPDVSDVALVAELDAWLAPALDGVQRWGDIARADLGRALLSLVPHGKRGSFDTLAPTHITVATGSRIPVDYADPAAPTLSVRMQELFGTANTPSVGGGRVALTLHLLSPAHRPLQVTRDLAGFWRGSYAEVRKEMRGRYPRHPWPENPLEAEATRRAKPRKPPQAN